MIRFPILLDRKKLKISGAENYAFLIKVDETKILEEKIELIAALA